jgi:hypothetical protein
LAPALVVRLGSEPARAALQSDCRALALAPHWVLALVPPSLLPWLALVV